MTAGSWIIVAASSKEDAARFAAREGIRPAAVETGPELLARWRGLRRWVRDRGIDSAILHSLDWRRESYPQVFLLLLCALPVKERWLMDERSGVLRQLTPPALALAAACMPFEVLDGALCVASAVLRNHRGLPLVADAPRPGSGRAVMALWPGYPGAEVGGSITHISGILGAFRRSGLRVGLLTAASVPAQLRAAVDETRIVPPLRPGRRLTGDVQRICANEVFRAEAAAMALSLRPAFVYQRNAPFMVAGVECAAALGVPLVLEWNGSEVWTRLNWEPNRPGVEKVFDALAESMEQRVVSQADVVSSVSEVASEQALRSGGSPDRVLLVPNAVDVGEIRPRGGRPTAGSAALGWIGSFGTWHGAPMLVRAMAMLPERVRLVMIGDGVERRQCEDLACDLGVENRIDWKGKLPHDEALMTLGDCDVLVSPHVPIPGVRFFGSPTKLFEYMALGKPIVASRLEQLGEVLEDGRTARLVEPGDVEDLASGIRDVLADPEKARRMGRAARTEAERHHTWDARARTILEGLGLDGEGN